MIFHIPFPQILKAITIASAITARKGLTAALLTAEGARESPIQMMMGPVTTGGRKCITFLTPTSLINNERTR